MVLHAAGEDRGTIDLPGDPGEVTMKTGAEFLVGKIPSPDLVEKTA